MTFNNRASEQHSAIRLAEQVMQLLDRGSFAATYKYAVLLALMDLCLEKTSKSGAPPDIVTTRELAAKVLELYWPQTRAYEKQPGQLAMLRQNTGSQAKILVDIERFKQHLQVRESSLHQAMREQAERSQRLLDNIEWTLISMPLPRVQVVGKQQLEVLYKIGWGLEIERCKRMVSEYQRGKPSDFDNRIAFLPEVSANLVMLSGLLRPLIHREWIRMVAHINKLEEARLEQFLFGAERISTARLRAGLVDIQSDRCFYCGDALRSSVELDHFVPWARYPDDGIENLVAAHARCNGNKRDFLAAEAHVEHWHKRLQAASSTARQLQQLAQDASWQSHPLRTLGVARGIYLHLPEHTLLWRGLDEFVPVQPLLLRQVLAA